MSAFTTPLAFEALAGRTRGRRPLVRLSAAFHYDVGYKGSGLTVKVPAGFVTDFASVPWCLRTWFPPAGPWAKAAVVHDFLYETGLISRAIADRIFYEAMGVLDVPAWRRFVMYAAVKAIGWRSFGRGPTGTPSA